MVFKGLKCIEYSNFSCSFSTKLATCEDFISLKNPYKGKSTLSNVEIRLIVKTHILMASVPYVSDLSRSRSHSQHRHTQNTRHSLARVPGMPHHCRLPPTQPFPEASLEICPSTPPGSRNPALPLNAATARLISSESRLINRSRVTL